MFAFLLVFSPARLFANVIFLAKLTNKICDFRKFGLQEGEGGEKGGEGAVGFSQLLNVYLDNTS